MKETERERGGEKNKEMRREDGGSQGEGEKKWDFKMMVFCFFIAVTLRALVRGRILERICIKCPVVLLRLLLPFIRLYLTSHGPFST